MMLQLKKRLLVVLLPLLALTGCGVGGSSQDKPAPYESVLLAIRIEVFTSKNVHVTVSFERGAEAEALVSCTYPGGDHVGRNTDPQKLADVVRNDSFDFTLTTPGTYDVTCTMGGVTKSASFTIGDAAGSPSPSASTSARIEDFKTGVLGFLYDSVTSSTAGFKPIFNCLPGQKYPNGKSTFTLASDGTFSGDCLNTETRRQDYTIVHSSQFVDGKLSRDGTVTFTLAAKMVTTSKVQAGEHIGLVVIRTLDGTFKGVGGITDGDTATGKSEWTVDCNFNTFEDGSVCPTGEAKPGRITGNVDWIIQFHP